MDVNEQHGLISRVDLNAEGLSRARISISGGGLGVPDATQYLQTKEDADYKIAGVPRMVTASAARLHPVNVVQRPRMVYFWKSTYKIQYTSPRDFYVRIYQEVLRLFLSLGRSYVP
ncbi:PREDICTED: uncharacterized protein LOC106749495 [Dinoponera quadriceps]|uniref:Uncharacterized protein LOC106749495 n=1 Tax=Dinoponera quadriceps TaxID=609295 RepID=A0A6P3Y2X3_DINQU|nr:PREDICTED: uncharacterized protein LOC106749495 [Dinoponera quadriceps]